MSKRSSVEACARLSALPVLVDRRASGLSVSVTVSPATAGEIDVSVTLSIVAMGGIYVSVTLLATMQAGSTFR